jgi:hypothetical protein
MVLAACGAVWLSVRGQHSYRGPTAADIPILIVFIVINFGVTVAVREHAIAGVRGRTLLRPAEITLITLAWVAAAAVMTALAAAGVSYSLYPTTVLIVPGLAWAAIMAAREGWRSCGTGLAVAAVGAVGAFAGPAGAWAVAGVGPCAVLLGEAAAVAWRQFQRRQVTPTSSHHTTSPGSGCSVTTKPSATVSKGSPPVARTSCGVPV